MTWALSAVGSWASQHQFSAHNFAVSAPSGSGGILLLKVFDRNAVGYSVSSGWTSIETSPTRVGLYARISDGGAEDSPTVYIAGASVACAQISRWTGGNTTLGSLLNFSGGSYYIAAEVSPNGNITVEGLTPSVNNCLVLRMGMTRNDDGTWTTPPSGDTLGSQVQVNLDDDMSAAWVYRIQTTASSVSTGDITNGAASAEGYSLAVALTPGSDDSPLILPHRSSGGMIDLSGNFRG